jgi:alpha-beta hydrolase superfamily lysophospholipase
MFKDVLHDQLGTWPLAYIPYGGADYGEIERIAADVGDGDDTRFHDAWTAAAERLIEEAHAALAQGHLASAHDAFLQAACCYGKSYHPLFGAPVDPRVRAGARRQIQAFELGLALAEDGSARLPIPFADTPLPAYFIPAARHARRAGRRPLIVITNGYDATITDPYFACVVAAVQRGYHCLIFDGPGQGSMLFEHGVPLRPDWETVIRAVLDVAVTLPDVDPARIALSGWSLGGYLAPRAAAFEARLAACIADPAQIDVGAGFRTAALDLGATPEQARDLGALPDAVLARMDDMLRRDRRLHWNVMRRGYWTHGVSDLRAYLASVQRFTLADYIGRIRCPVLVTRASADPLAAGAEAFYEALDCPKTLLHFSAADGAGAHCEMGNRSLLNRRVLDWLDDVL